MFINAFEDVDEFFVGVCGLVDEDVCSSDGVCGENFRS